MARHYIAFETVKNFVTTSGGEDLSALLKGDAYNMTSLAMKGSWGSFKRVHSTRFQLLSLPPP